METLVALGIIFVAVLLMEPIIALGIIVVTLLLFATPISILGRRFAVKSFQFTALALQTYASTPLGMRKSKEEGNKLVKNLCILFRWLQYFRVKVEEANELMEKAFSELPENQKVGMSFRTGRGGNRLQIRNWSHYVECLVSGRYRFFE